MGRPIRFPDPLATQRRVLANPTRRRVLELLIAEPGGLTTEQLRQRLGVHRATAHHLVAPLVDAGLAATAKDPVERGRPANRYRALVSVVPSLDDPVDSAELGQGVHHVGVAMRARRVAAGLSLPQVADRARVPLPVLADVESGLIVAPQPVLARVAVVLDLSVARLMWAAQDLAAAGGEPT